jgi:hypothetical protein
MLLKYLVSIILLTFSGLVTATPVAEALTGCPACPIPLPSCHSESSPAPPGESAFSLPHFSPHSCPVSCFASPTLTPSHYSIPHLLSNLWYPRLHADSRTLCPNYVSIRKHYSPPLPRSLPQHVRMREHFLCGKIRPLYIL